MTLSPKYFDRLATKSSNFKNFEVNKNQNYLYSNKSFKPWHNFAKKFFLKKFKNAIEIGCGNGALIEKIIADYKVGLDLDINAARLLNKSKVNFRLESIQSFASDPINNEFFDVIFAFEVIEHFPNPLDFVIASKIILKSGGLIVGSTPNSQRWWLDIYKREEFDEPPNHFVTFSRVQIQNLFSDYGFEVLFLGPAFFYQDWRHVHYRLSMIFEDLISKSPYFKKIGYLLSIFFTPIFFLMNLVPNKYLHHGFVVRKI
jgi:SAM-dependent methyltransferase